MSRSKNYKKIKSARGIYQNEVTGNYLVEKRVKGKLHTTSFPTLFEAKQWQKYFDGTKAQAPKEGCQCATLKEVWESMQKNHFPILARSTKEMWLRRYNLLMMLEHLPMDQITTAKVSEWVVYWVSHFSSEDYQTGRGRAGRCHLNNELNLLVSIFNWYKESELYEKEAQYLTCPVKKKHRKMGFIKPLPDKRKQIELHHAFLFFESLRPLYRDLAQMQFYTAGRIGEVSGIQWKNVDMKNRRLLIKETCIWDMTKKTFVELKQFPKNREPRAVFITDEIMEVLKRREAFRIAGNDFVFHVEGNPLNYCTIQLNYREAQRKSGVPYTGTHILRHGMAKLARQIGGGLDAVIAMTGHKDLKLADHYSKSNEDDQKHFSEMIMNHIRKRKAFEQESKSDFENVIQLKRVKIS